MKKIISPNIIALSKSLKELEKGRYVDNYINRKKGRVGQEWEFQYKENIHFNNIFKYSGMYESKKCSNKKWKELLNINTYFYIENDLNKDHYYIHTDESKKESVGGYDAKENKLYLKPGYDIKDFSKKKPKEYEKYYKQRYDNNQIKHVGKEDVIRKDQEGLERVQDENGNWITEEK